MKAYERVPWQQGTLTMRILRSTFRFPHNGLIVIGTIRMMSSLTWEGVEKYEYNSSLSLYDE